MTYQPEFMERETLDAPITRAALHEKACAFAEQEFRQRGTTGYLWLIAIRNEVRWVRTLWSDEHEKAMTVRWMRDVMAIVQAHAYATVQEAWAAHYSEDMPPADKALVVKAQEEGLYILPDRLRDDLLMVWSFGGDHGADAAMTRYLVTIRQPIGPNFLGPRADEDVSQLHEHHGRMWNLLKEDLEADRLLMDRLPKLVARMRKRGVEI